MATARITGASSGIGAAPARIHAERGGDLVLVARRRDRLEALQSELERPQKVRATVIAEDLTDADAASRFHSAVKQAEIEVDCLISYAGVGARGRCHEMPWGQALAVIQVNSVAPAGLIRAVLPDFVARDSGRILNVASTGSEMPGPLRTAHFASKAFAAYLSNALVEGPRNTRVTVTSFMPAATATEFAATAGMDGTASCANTASARAVAQDGCAAVLRGDLDACGGMTLKRRAMQMVANSSPRRAQLRAVRRAPEAVRATTRGGTGRPCATRGAPIATAARSGAATGRVGAGPGRVGWHVPTLTIRVFAA